MYAVAAKPAWAHCFEAGNAMLKAGDFRKAIQAFSDSLTSCTDEKYRAGICCARGLALCFARRYSEAILDLSFAIRSNPAYADAYHLRGICYKQLNHIEKAIEDFDTAIALGKRDGESYANRAAAYATLAMLEFAAIDLIEAARVDGTKQSQLEKLMKSIASPLTREALKQFAANELVTALHLCSRAVQANPHDTVIFYIAACAYIRLDVVDEARTTFQHCFDLACKQPGRVAKEIARTCSREIERMQTQAPPTSLRQAA